MNYFDIIYNSIIHLTECLIYLLLFICFTGKRSFIRKNPARTVFYLILFSAFAYWIYTYIPKGPHSAIHLMVSIILLVFLTKANLYTSAISSVLTLAFIMVTETLTVTAMFLLMKTDLNTLRTTQSLMFTFAICTRLIQYSVITVLFRFKFRVFKHDIFNRENSILAFTLFQIITIGILLLSLNIAIVNRKNILLYNLFVCAIYLVFVVINIMDLREREKTLALKQTVKNQKKYAKNLESVINIIRREKHDFTNHLNTLFAMSVIKKTDSLQRIENYLRKLTDNLVSSYQIYNSGNEYIDGLLAVKSNYAYEHQVKFEVKFDIPLTEAFVDDSDLISIIGNIIDNAFDAILSKPSEKNTYVALTSYMLNENYYLCIENNGPMIPEKIIEKICDNGFTTKNQDGRNRGFGLFITKQLVTKNQGNMTVASSEQKTEFLLIFKLKPNGSRKPIEISA